MVCVDIIEKGSCWCFFWICYWTILLDFCWLLSRVCVLDFVFFDIPYLRICNSIFSLKHCNNIFCSIKWSSWTRQNTAICLIAFIFSQPRHRVPYQVKVIRITHIIERQCVAQYIDSWAKCIQQASSWWSIVNRQIKSYYARNVDFVLEVSFFLS